MPFAPPPRRRGVEYLDDPTLDPAVAARSLADVARANLLFGGRRAVLREIDTELVAAAREGRRVLTLLDVGAGMGDIPEAATLRARRFGVTLHTVGLEMTGPLAALARRRTWAAVAADARALPFATRAIDVVCCSQLLHHLDDPEARVVVGHGQMTPHDLEKAMVAFVRKDAEILVATTIIESGLDIPTANTIFINDADIYGLADLHQLRGRVGRSKLRAYAYLMVNPLKMLNPTAQRRLKAIEEFTELGA
ncbi:MAG: methyltransferase domain-containing protein, partial [Gemmatimonadaceae bacterium]|nr:methyltransferase domain-containing protein [Gemmatimonadaceae bacterium]